MTTQEMAAVFVEACASNRKVQYYNYGNWVNLPATAKYRVSPEAPKELWIAGEITGAVFRSELEAMKAGYGNAVCYKPE